MKFWRVHVVRLLWSVASVFFISGFAVGEDPSGSTAASGAVSAAVRVVSSSVVSSGQAGDAFVYFGTYTGAKSDGIYIFRLEGASGRLTSVGVAASVNPSFLAIHPNRRFLYAVSEIQDFDGKKTGGVSSFAIEPKTGKLTPLNQQPSKGAGPCHLVVDQTGASVLVANYGGGSVAALPIGDDGRVGPATGFVQHAGSSVNPQRQQGPHAHSINLDPENRFAVAADLGLDQVLVYRFDPKHGTLTTNKAFPAATVAPGAGPRHFAFHPSGRFGYVINEINSTVTAFRYDTQHGTLETLHTVSSLPKDFTGGNSTADVQVHPSGRFLYGSNRGHDSIVVFRIDAETGKLSDVEHESTQGKTPRNFGIEPAGTFLLAENQASNTVVVFRIDQATGELTPTGITAEVPSPVCAKFLPVQ